MSRGNRGFFGCLFGDSFLFILGFHNGGFFILCNCCSCKFVGGGCFCCFVCFTAFLFITARVAIIGILFIGVGDLVLYSSLTADFADPHGIF